MASIENAAAPREGRLPWGFALGIVMGVSLALAAFVAREVMSREEAPPLEAPRVIFVPTAVPVVTLSSNDATVYWRTKESLNVKVGPADGYAIIGVLPKDAAVIPVEWASRGAWVAIQFPPNSSGRGWLPANAIAQPTPVATASPPAGTVDEVLKASPEQAAPVAAPVPSEPPLQLWRFTVAIAIGVPVLAIGFVWNRIRAGHVRFAAVTAGEVQGGPVEDVSDKGVTPDAPAVDYQTAAPQPRAAVIYSPTPVPPMEEKKLTSEFGQEQQPEQSQPEEQIRKGVTDFSQTLKDLTANICSAVDKLGGDVGQAIAAFAAEQRATLRRQEELLAETKRISEQAQTEAERATQAATRASSSHDSADELLSKLQSDRDGLTQLINDVRNRIAALSVLAAPLPETPVAAPSSTESQEPPTTPSWGS